jgi:hypothetical protein
VLPRAEISAAKHKKGRQKFDGAGKISGRILARFIKKGAELFLGFVSHKFILISNACIYQLAYYIFPYHFGS